MQKASIEKNPKEATRVKSCIATVPIKAETHVALQDLILLMLTLLMFLKNERVHHRTYSTRAHARADIFDFIELFYNRRRLHQSIGYRVPMVYGAEVMIT